MTSQAMVGEIGNRIAAIAVTRFATENGIDPTHLLKTPSELTPVELLRATRVLGPEIFSTDGSVREVRRPSGVDEQLRSLDD